MAIFFGFLVLLLRSLILWGRGFDPSFDFWIFGTDQVLGKIYALFKDIFTVVVFFGALVFIYYRAVARLKRMTLSTEGSHHHSDHCGDDGGGRALRRGQHGVGSAGCHGSGDDGRVAPRRR